MPSSCSAGPNGYTAWTRAKAAFEESRACADAHGLPLWRLRALHELGTIDLFDHAGSRRLEQAREAAEDLGAVSMVAVLDVQLSAASLFRFEPDAAIRHASSALAAADRLRLAQLRATALAFLAENSGMLGDVGCHGALQPVGTGRRARRSRDRRLGMGRTRRRSPPRGRQDRCGPGPASRGRDPRPLPNAGPAIYLGLWPLLLAVTADARCQISDQRRAGRRDDRQPRESWTALDGRGGDRRPPSTRRRRTPKNSWNVAAPISCTTRCGPTSLCFSRRRRRWRTAGGIPDAGWPRPARHSSANTSSGCWTALVCS